MKNTLIPILLLLLFNSCENKQSSVNDLSVITIDLSRSDFFVDEPAFSDFKYVRLETNDDCLMSDIFKAVHAGQRIYALSLIESTVFIFEENGRYISKLAVGQGPGEVQFVNDIAVNDGKLYVMDWYKTLKEFDLDGNYIRDIVKFDMNYFSFAMTPTGIYLADSNANPQSDYNIHFISKDGENMNFIEKKDWSRNFNIMVYDFLQDDFLTWPISDTIYQVKEDAGEIVPAYFVDFKGKGINQQHFEQINGKYDIDAKKYAAWIKYFIRLEDGCFFNFHYEKPYYAKSGGQAKKVFSRIVDNLPDNLELIGFDGNSLIFSCSTSAL